MMCGPLNRVAAFDSSLTSRLHSAKSGVHDIVVSYLDLLDRCIDDHATLVEVLDLFHWSSVQRLAQMARDLESRNWPDLQVSVDLLGNASSILYLPRIARTAQGLHEACFWRDFEGAHASITDMNGDFESLAAFIKELEKESATSAPVEISATKATYLKARAEIILALYSKSIFLVVDDSALNRKVIRRMLESAHAELPDAVIMEADDGDVAVAMCQAAADRGDPPFNCIFMDQCMGRMNGDEATQILRTSLNYQGMIFGITGNALGEDIASFKAHGANAVVVKPLTAPNLFKIMKAHNLMMHDEE